MTVSPNVSLHESRSAPIPVPPPALTRHACVRKAGRAIPAEVIDWLFDHGSWSHAAAGAEIVCFDRLSRRAIERRIGHRAYARFERVLSTAYAVVAADGSIVTVGHRTRRLRRA